MKKILYLLALLFPLYILSGCSEEDIVFEHEKPQFELESDAILIEVIVPMETAATDELYIVGDFNGGPDALGQLEYKLQRSENTKLKWGIYLYPSFFKNGKTLADGFFFYNVTQGTEITLNNESVMHYLEASVGNRYDEKVIRWEAFFKSSTDWPIIPLNKIMLQLTVPDYTPFNAKINIYGFINGWNGSDKVYEAKMLSETKYYIILDPHAFAVGTDLSQQFKFALMRNGKEWWYHQDNADGSEADGEGHFIEGAKIGNGYEINLLNWARKSEITDDPEPSDGYLIKIKATDEAFNPLYVYSWGGTPNVEIFGGWPGLLLSADDKGWYSLVVPYDTPNNLILNNNGTMQFDFLKDVTESACYEVSFANSTWTAVDCGNTGDSYLVKFKVKNNTWSDIAVYSWGGTPNVEIFGGWPGKLLTPDSKGWYSCSIPFDTPNNLILNNNNGGMQFDFINNVNESNCYEIDMTAKSWSKIDCE